MKVPESKKDGTGKRTSKDLHAEFLELSASNPDRVYLSQSGLDTPLLVRRRDWAEADRNPDSNESGGRPRRKSEEPDEDDVRELFDLTEHLPEGYAEFEKRSSLARQSGAETQVVAPIQSVADYLGRVDALLEDIDVHDTSSSVDSKTSLNGAAAGLLDTLAAAEREMSLPVPPDHALLQRQRISRQDASMAKPRTGGVRAIELEAGDTDGVESATSTKGTPEARHEERRKKATVENHVHDATLLDHGGSNAAAVAAVDGEHGDHTDGGEGVDVDVDVDTDVDVDVDVDGDAGEEGTLLSSDSDENLGTYLEKIRQQEAAALARRGILAADEDEDDLFADIDGDYSPGDAGQLENGHGIGGSQRLPHAVTAHNGDGVEMQPGDRGKAQGFTRKQQRGAAQYANGNGWAIEGGGMGNGSEFQDAKTERDLLKELGLSSDEEEAAYKAAIGMKSLGVDDFDMDPRMHADDESSSPSSSAMGSILAEIEVEADRTLAKLVEGERI